MLKNIISEGEDPKPLCINFEKNCLGLIKMILRRSFSMVNDLKDNCGDLKFYDLSSGLEVVCAPSTYWRVFWTHAVSGMFQKTSRQSMLGFPAGSVVKNPPAGAGDMGSIPEPGRSLCHGATRLHHSCGCAPATEPVPRPQEPRAPSPHGNYWSLRSATREAAANRGPRPGTRKSPGSHEDPAHSNK